MAKFRTVEKNQLFMLNVDLEAQLIPGSLEFAINHLIEENLIITNGLELNYINDKTGRPAVHPKVLLKVILWAYSNGILSSRDIEAACKTNITFMALAGMNTPDHATISRFILRHSVAIKNVFSAVLSICDEENLLGHTMFALDGVKLSSNAAKENSGRREDFIRKVEKLEKKIQNLLESHTKSDLAIQEKERTIRAVHSLNQKKEKIEKWLSENDDRKGKRSGTVQSNITDNDSAKMHSSHGIVQGYNAQALVDHKNQIIVAAEVIGSNSDQEALKEIVNQVNANDIPVSLKDSILLADNGYHSDSNLEICINEGINAFIPDAYFRKRDQKFSDVDKYKPDKRFTHEQFEYNETVDQYICPAKKVLKRSSVKSSLPGYQYRRYQSVISDCAACSLRLKCLRNAHTKRRTLMIQEKAPERKFSEAMRTKIDTPEGKIMYSHRMQIVEPVFANIRYNKGMNRINYRGKLKANAQWLLYCIVHNIEKIARYGPTFASMVKT